MTYKDYVLCGCAHYTPSYVSVSYPHQSVWGLSRAARLTGCFRFFPVHSFQRLLFPAAGYRNGLDGRVNNVGWGCYAWSASPYSATSQNGGFLNTNSNWVNPVNNTNRSNAFPVRCVREITGLNFV